MLAVVYEYRTEVPRAVVALGAQRGLPRGAKLADGRLPVLGLSDDGLTVQAERPGDHTLTLDLEVPVVPRGAKGEQGFDVGLPRAAITTLAFDPPAPGVKRVTVGTRTPDRPAEVRKTTYPTDRLTAKGEADRTGLGPTDLLDVAWDAPTAPAPAAEQPAAADTEVVVQVDDTRVESTARLRLRGAAREWLLVLPPGADVAVERVGAADTGPLARTLTRPTDPGKALWTVKVPEGLPAEWVVTATVRQARPKPTDPRFRGPYPVGPFAAPAARQTGTVRVTAAPGVWVWVNKEGPGVRGQDAPADPDKDLVYLFRFAAPPNPASKSAPPLLELDARPATGTARAEPAYHLRRTEAGWRLDADVKVTPPVGGAVQQFTVEWPEGWGENVQVDLDKLVFDLDEPKTPASPRVTTVRLAAPTHAPFVLKLTRAWPVAPAARDATVRLPRFPQVAEVNARVTAAVPEGLELKGTAISREGGPAGGVSELSPVPVADAAPRAAGVQEVGGSFEKGVGAVDLTWQPYRPDLTAEVRADVTLWDRQVTVTERLTLRVADPAGWRGVRLQGPAGMSGLSRPPSLAGIGSGGLELIPPADGVKEVSFTMSYGLPGPPRGAAR